MGLTDRPAHPDVQAGRVSRPHLIGPNEAGKSTLLQLAVGLTGLAVGEIAVLDGTVLGSPEALDGIAFVHPRNDLRSFALLLKRAGLRRVRLHDLRHTTASLLVAQGVPARVVMEILGHSQISITMNLYSHVVPEVSREAADRIESVLWAAGQDPAGPGESSGQSS